MKEEIKINPRDTQVDLGKSSEKVQSDASRINLKQNEKEVDTIEKMLEDRPGAYLLKDISVDEENSSIKNKVNQRPPVPDEEITSEDEDFDEAGDDPFNDDELGLDSFGDYEEYD